MMIKRYDENHRCLCPMENYPNGICHRCLGPACAWFCVHSKTKDDNGEYIYYGECAVKEIAMRLKAGADNGEKSQND